jgi:hypothetical protein
MSEWPVPAALSVVDYGLRPLIFVSLRLRMTEVRDFDTDILMPLEFDGQTLYIAARDVNVDDPFSAPRETQIVARERRFEAVLEGVAGFAKQVVTTMQITEASKVTIQFGCEIAVESGSFVAVIGKGAAKTTMTVSLEWASPAS